MTLLARARTLAVLLALASGAIALISSTQTWFDVVLAQAADAAVTVAGESAVPVLAPLALAVMASSLALTIAGRALAAVLGLVLTAIGVALCALVFPIAATAPVSALARTVTEHTGIAGSGVSELVSETHATPWPWVTAVMAVAVTLAGVWALATFRRWTRAGRRYRTDRGDREAASSSEALSPDGADTRVDAIDAWDDLSRGDDPTGARSS